MIGVIADRAEHDVVREFFELFKTPWEFWRRNKRYDVVLSTGAGELDDSARVTLLYTGHDTRLQGTQPALVCREQDQPRMLLFARRRIPIYGSSVTFPATDGGVLTDEASQGCVAYAEERGGRIRIRVGYDLFREVRTLLKEGQPNEHATLPTLELHIEVLRSLITACGIPLAEVPPVPQGYGFIACLTHDVDHPSLRQHGWDSTTIGFLFRAALESCWSLVRGHISFVNLLQSWFAAVKVPFVQMGMAKDFWRDFDERYAKLEGELPSTYFFIPFRNLPGRKADGPASWRRASGYGAKDVADKIRSLVASGHEVGLHGIDAWLDEAAAREELAEVRAISGVPETGSRMHWLFFNEQSAAVLERAGVAYDSTVGFNQTVGYRAGTTQAYKPLTADRLLELPMHLMDTALFYHSYLGLTQPEALRLAGSMIDDVQRFGGCLTINWHDRSLAPERFWDRSYRELLRALRERRAWFATAANAVSWFNKRRTVVFETDATEPGGVRARLASDGADTLPGLRLRLHKARSFDALGGCSADDYVDLPLDEHAPADLHVTQEQRS